ncbi:methylated-DNA--[protein]-cysteine S-methyltransferase [Actinocatenispora comari]|uniref:Methylated-DNA--protein-cysteine methyltransferase n=1 Tax=Actinocatenispora comari TaxID=2807577 RepID=A0A8J4AL14_9ACTN|nr:methylated-DNA--[protein]-cysteine S-methyltransferase [Actinocatenispora comari]GIL30693.1 methylated-DNA--protein-cysteine methyltransferase [Actinocatenispora comari]
MRWLSVPSPIGDLIAVADDDALRQLRFGGPAPAGEPSPADPVLAATRSQLDEYFAGRRTGFDLPLHLVGSEFERAVWAELTRIPYGETCSYGDVARAVADDVGASRAVGTANNHNPIPVIVPCHRVVGANRKLVGYGGGLPRKVFLLELEARVQLTAGGLFSG